MRQFKLLVAVALACLVLIGYPAASWLLGKQVEAALDDQYKNLNGLLPLIKLSNRKFERGIFTSRETETVTLISPLTEPVQFTLHSTIRHGPIFGFTTFAVATVDSELEVNEGFKQDVAKWVGDKKILLSMHTLFHFDGRGDTTVSMPGFHTPRLAWDGMSMNIGFAKNLASYVLQGDIPKINVGSKGGSQLQITGIHLDRSQKRIFDDEPLLFSGTNKLTVAQLDFTAGTQGLEAMLPSHLLMEQLAIDDALAVNHAEFVDYVSKVGTNTFKVRDQDYGPSHFDMSLLHLHARTVANLIHANLDRIQKDGPNSLNNQESLAAFTSFNQEMINHNAEFRLDRLSFTRPQGEALLTASIKAKEASGGDLPNKPPLLSRLVVTVDVKIPEELLIALSKNKFASNAQSEEQVRAGLAARVAEGYFTKESGNVKTRFEFHDGQMWLNGKQYVQPVTNMMAGNSPPQLFPAPPAAPAGTSDVAKRLNCTACHSINRRVIGPSWIDVANRYKDVTVLEYQGRQYPLEDGLVLEISKGGSGHWGYMPMPAIDPMGKSQDEIRAQVRYILGLTRPDFAQNNIGAPSTAFRQAEVIPPFKLGESYETFAADMKTYGSKGAVIDPHSSSSVGDVTYVLFAGSGVRLYFMNRGQHNLYTIRYEPPYAGKIRGIGIGDSLFKLHDALGNPDRPPWRFGFYMAYVYTGEDDQTYRFDVADGVVKTMFLAEK